MIAVTPVTYMDPSQVLYALDGSVDEDDWCYPCEAGGWDPDGCTNDYHWQENLLELFMEKFDEVYEDFIESIATKGVRVPICIAVDQDGRWFQGNGHHRLIVAIMKNVERIPVVFSFDGDYMHKETTGSIEEMNFMGETGWDPHEIHDEEEEVA